MKVDDTISQHLAKTLFNQLSGVAYFVKDTELRYTSANATMCEMCGASENDVLGRRSLEFFSSKNASRGEAAEREILQSKRPSGEALSKIVGLEGRESWVVVRRWPILSQCGQAMGIAGLARLLPDQARRTRVYSCIAGAVDHINRNYWDALEVRNVAKAVGLSLDRLEREFSFIFGLSPRDYITKVRLEAASERLVSGDSIADVAQACGYSDQSAFARRFRRQVGMSPSEFRRRYR